MAKIIWRPSNQENAHDGQAVAEEQGNDATDVAGRDDKLEIRTDAGWFAAELTLREDGITNVHFDEFSVEEDEQWDAEKIKSLNPLSKSVRVISEQLQDEQCGIVNVNRNVCVLRTAGEKEGWHDAVVTEIRRRRHNFRDEGETCTCLFAVTWRDGPGKGLTERNLTCAEICLLSKKNVETHPLVVDMLRRASVEGRKEQEKERPSSSAPGVRRSDGGADDNIESSGELVYRRRRLRRLKAKNTDASLAKDSLQQSELVVDDSRAVTPSVHSEFGDVPPSSSRSTELFEDNSLSSHSAQLIREITAEIFAGANHLKQSKQPLVATPDVPPLTSPAATITEGSTRRIIVDHLTPSTQAVEATQDVLPLSSPAAADSNRAIKRMRADSLKQLKHAVGTINVDHSTPSTQTAEATQDVLPLSSPAAAADSSRAIKRMRADNLKQLKLAVETRQCAAQLSHPAAADCSKSKKRKRVEQLQQSKHGVETTQDGPPISSSALDDSKKALKKMRGQLESDDECPSYLTQQRGRIFGTRSSERVGKAEEQQKKTAMEPSDTISPKEAAIEPSDTISPKEAAMEPSDKVHTCQVQQTPTISPKAKSVEDLRGKTKDFIDLTEEGDCELPVKNGGTVKATADSLEEHHTISPKAKPVEDLRVKTKDFIDLTEEEDCELPVKKGGTVRAMADSLEEHHSSKPTPVQVKKEDVKCKTDFLEDHHLNSKPIDGSGGNDGLPKLPSDLDIKEVNADPILMQKRAGSLTATDENTKARLEVCEAQKKIEFLASKSDGQRSKKVRITFEFDMEVDESASFVDGLSLSRSFPAGAKVTSYSPNYEEPVDSSAKSEAMATTCSPSESKPEAPLSCPPDCPPPERKDEKLFHGSVIKVKGLDNGRAEELPGPVHDRVGGPKKNDPSVEPKAEVEGESKFVMNARPTARSGNEHDQENSKSRLRVGSASETAICLSDEEEDGIIAGSKIPPTSSSMAFASTSNLSGLGPALTDDQQRDGNVNLRNNQARNRSASIKNVLARSGCILVIDNLEVGVPESALREQFLKFFDKEKIQSVTIPRPHPELNRATGYVIFSDKEAADAAAGILASCVIVSPRGRPWVVRTQGQEQPDVSKAGLMDDVLDSNAVSSPNFKVLTKRQRPEYIAARYRQRVFYEHLKQSRVMFQGLAQEEAKLDSNPDPVL